MTVNLKDIEKVFESISEKSVDFSMPAWDELPDLELYMDQVITLITKYLGGFSKVTENEKIITSSMINNYVKLGTIPPPIKKRYSRVHLAYLLMVCTLKQTLDMSTIQKLIPVGIPEERVQELYGYFAKNQKRAHKYLIKSIGDITEKVVINQDGSDADGTENLIMLIASTANIFKILTEYVADAVNTESEKDKEENTKAINSSDID